MTTCIALLIGIALGMPLGAAVYIMLLDKEKKMNSEGYRTPTEDKAIGNESRRERLRKKYHIREGDIIKMKIEIRPDKAKEETVTKKVRVRIKEIHTHLVTVEYPWGVIESFTWWDFERRRI